MAEEKRATWTDAAAAEWRRLLLDASQGQHAKFDFDGEMLAGNI